jgi:hypothetical protein
MEYQNKMNAHSIKEYILKLEKENMELREQLEAASTHAVYFDDEESVSSAEDVNAELAERFYAKADKEENPHKKHAYKNVGDIIKTLHFEVSHGEDVKHIRGIGKSAVRLINQWLNV